MSFPVVLCRQLRFSRGTTEVLHGIDFSVPKGGIVGLLGKNGAGKSTTIGVLMGYLAPDAGECRVLGQPSTSLSEDVRERIGLLHEGFIQYNFMTIEEIERFYAPFYQKWDSSVFWDLVNRMHIPKTRRISRLSCGQRSQITLGLILAQQAELLILDDFSLGLDVGYRRLFLEFLRDYVNKTNATVLLTSHVVGELDEFLDHVIVIKEGRVLCDESRADFRAKYHRYVLPVAGGAIALEADGRNAINVEHDPDRASIYSTEPIDVVRAWLKTRRIDESAVAALCEEPMTFEDTFVGITGRY